MHHLTLALALTTAVSAIDIRFYNRQDCQETSWAGCTNVNPGYCCAALYYYNGISFNAIPSSWSIVARGHVSEPCNMGFRPAYVIQGQTDRCISQSEGGLYSGGSYVFYNRKRSEGGAVGECKSVKPDVVSLADGQKYDISGLDDELVKELVDFAFNGTTTEDIPAAYAGLAIQE